jgi:hypothetical protein
MAAHSGTAHRPVWSTTLTHAGEASLGLMGAPTHGHSSPETRAAGAQGSHAMLWCTPFGQLPHGCFHALSIPVPIPIPILVSIPVPVSIPCYGLIAAKCPFRPNAHEAGIHSQLLANLPPSHADGTHRAYVLGMDTRHMGKTLLHVALGDLVALPGAADIRLRSPLFCCLQCPAGLLYLLVRGRQVWDSRNAIGFIGPTYAAQQE